MRRRRNESFMFEHTHTHTHTIGLVRDRLRYYETESSAITATNKTCLLPVRIFSAFSRDNIGAISAVYSLHGTRPSPTHCQIFHDPSVKISYSPFGVFVFSFFVPKVSFTMKPRCSMCRRKIFKFANRVPFVALHLMITREGILCERGERKD